MSQRLITVVGASGNQGSGVVSALLSTQEYRIRAITTNPDSARAKALLERHFNEIKEGRFEIVEGNLNDKSSLENAFQGSYGLFASFGPGPTPEDGEEAEEVKQGKNLVDAAKAAGIEHFVYSSLSSVREESQGKLNDIHHRESKVAVEQYAKEKLPCVTSIQPAAFFSNLAGRGWSKKKDDASIVLCAPFGANVRLAWTDDRKDVGTFARAIFDKGPSTMKGKSFFCASAPMSLKEIAAEYEKLSGERLLVEPLSVKEGARLTAEDMNADQSLAKELEDVFTYFNQIYDNLPDNALDGLINSVYDELGVKASNFEEFLNRSGWRVGKHS